MSKALLNYLGSAIAIFAVSGSIHAAEKNKYLLGSSLGVTGPLAELYTPWVNGATDYCKYVASEKLLGDDELKCQYLDDGLQAEKFKENINVLLDNKENKLISVVGVFPSHVEVIKDDLMGECVSVFGTNSELVHSVLPINFLPMTSASEIEVGSAEYIVDDYKKHGHTGKPKVGLLYWETGAIAEQWRNSLKEAIKQGLPIDLVYEAAHNGTEVDYTSQIAKATSKDVGVQYMLTITSEFAQSKMINDAKRLGVLASTFGQDGKISFAGNHFAGGRTLMKLVDPSVLSGSFVFSSSLNLNSNLVKKIGKMYQRDQDTISDMNYTMGIHFMKLAVDAMIFAKKNLGGISRPNVIRALNQMKDYKMDTLVGTLTYTPTVHRGSQMQQVYRLEKNSYVRVGKPFVSKYAPAVADKFTVNQTLDLNACH